MSGPNGSKLGVGCVFKLTFGGYRGDSVAYAEPQTQIHQDHGMRIFFLQITQVKIIKLRVIYSS